MPKGLGSRFRKLGRYGSFFGSQTVELHLVLECGAADAEGLGRAGNVAAGFREGVEDGFLLDDLG